MDNGLEMGPYFQFDLHYGDVIMGSEEMIISRQFVTFIG